MSSLPLLLAFDTSTATGSIAVGRGSEILGHALLLRRGEHASGLIPRIAETLAEAGLERSDIEGLVVGSGPGSFTGVRIAAATARGLRVGLGVPLWPRSSLAAAAASQGARIPQALAVRSGTRNDELPDEAEEWPRYVLFDARADRLYAACYRFAAGTMETVVEPHAPTLSAVLGSHLPEPVLFCGDGALRHIAEIEGAGHTVLPFPAGLPTAEGLLRVHALASDDPPVPSGSRWEPTYLRGSSAVRPGTGAEGKRG